MDQAAVCVCMSVYLCVCKRERERKRERETEEGGRVGGRRERGLEERERVCWGSRSRARRQNQIDLGKS